MKSIVKCIMYFVIGYDSRIHTVYSFVDYIIIYGKSKYFLYYQYSDAIEEFKRPLSDQAVNACCSCERLLRKKSVTEAKNLDSDVWNNLLDYIRENNPVALNKVM